MGYYGHGDHVWIDPGRQQYREHDQEADHERRGIGYRPLQRLLDLMASFHLFVTAANIQKYVVARPNGIALRRGKRLSHDGQLSDRGICGSNAASMVSLAAPKGQALKQSIPELVNGAVHSTAVPTIYATDPIKPGNQRQSNHRRETTLPHATIQ